MAGKGGLDWTLTNSHLTHSLTHYCRAISGWSENETMTMTRMMQLAGAAANVIDIGGALP